jgi:hypothetical protein
MSRWTTCVNENCDRDPFYKFVAISMDTVSAGRDWAQFYGHSLCKKCYSHYRHRGDFNGTHNQRITEDDKHCTYPGCTKPTQSNKFRRVQCKILCDNCYARYRRNKTVTTERASVAAPAEGHCSNSECSQPSVSSRFHLIHSKTRAGGRDWSSLEHSTLCSNCYQGFLRNGTLSRKRKAADT